MKSLHKMVLRNSSDKPKKQIVCTRSASRLKREHSQIIENEAHQLEASASERSLTSFDIIPKQARSVRDRRALILNPAPLHLNQLPHRKREIARRKKTYSCDICGKSFEKYHALGGHKSHHSKENKKARALAIEGGSSRPSNANDLVIVVNAKSHTCHLCGKEFAKAQSLAGHKGHCKYQVLRICS